MLNLALNNLKRDIFHLVKRIAEFYPDILEHGEKIDQGSTIQVSKMIQQEILKLTEKKKALIELLEKFKVYEKELREEK